MSTRKATHALLLAAALGLGATWMSATASVSADTSQPANCVITTDEGSQHEMQPNT
jgi:hypothetical protein